MRKRRPRARRGATTYATDEKLIENLVEHAPELLESKVSEAAFEASLDAILQLPVVDQIRHFYCRPCGEYHPKTHPHHAEMKRRKAKKRAQG